MKLEGNYAKFYDLISLNIDKKRIFIDPLRTLVYGTDASFYRLIPKIVIWANSAKEVQNIIKHASSLSLPMVFRAAGTSLSGQAITDSILIVTSRDWNSIEISDDLTKVRLSPSVVGSKANEALSCCGKKIGPDPASINSAMIGGIVANNASGMCCGTTDNSYKTIEDIKIIFHDGSTLDTADENSKNEFKKTHKDMLEKIKDLSNQIDKNPTLKEKIIKKFQIKNTCGYGLNSLVDFDDEFEIIKHLMVGSEGTLGFIEDVTLKTIPDFKDKASALLIFKSIKDACDAVAKLKHSCLHEVDAAELMDRRSLKSVENMSGMPPYLKSLSENATALLVETRAKDSKTLEKNIDTILNAIKEWECEIPANFTTDVEEYTTFWNIRKGLFPAVGGVREVGTTVIIEDVAYPMEDFAQGILDLIQIMKKHGYGDSIIFGHALDSNVHFVFTQKFETQSQKKQYDEFMKELAVHVAQNYQGSLKAEHGTGRNMAPFVPLEWGEEAYEIMEKIKKIFDPNSLLNPGVIINKDPQIHLKNLKILPKTNDIIDMCIECGFCEDVCPSNMLSLTPRQRIVANRHKRRIESELSVHDFEDFRQTYTYNGLETCATCSLCSTRCPVGIDMGNMTKYLRKEELTSLNKKFASFTSSNFNTLLSSGRVALKGIFALSHLNTNISKKAAQQLHKISKNRIPLWSESLPSGANILNDKGVIKSEKKVVYFSSCINQTMGNPKPQKDEKSLHEVVKSLLKKADYEVIIPKQNGKLCCGMPYFSKGYDKEGDAKIKELEDSLAIASQNGQYPIICDMSPCTKTIISHISSDIKVYGPAEFVVEFLLQNLSFTKTDAKVVIHKTCSDQVSNKASYLELLAKKCTDNVIIPKTVTCCGFAGDRGFTFPELNASALRGLKNEIPSDAKLAFSTSKTCEIGLSEHSGLAYRNILYLVDNCTKKML